MSLSNRHSLQEGVSNALLAWAKTWEEAGDKVRLNAVLEKRGTYSLIVSVALVTERYIDGSAMWDVPFALAYVDSWSDGVDGVNTNASAVGERWLDWVSEQFDAGNLPVVEGATIDLLEPLEGVPTLAMAYPDQRLAKYQFQAHMRLRV